MSLENGKIFSYDPTKGEGTILLDNGSTVEFSIKHWKDTKNLPEVGLEIVWDGDKITVKDKYHNEDEYNDKKLSNSDSKATISNEQQDIQGIASTVISILGIFLIPILLEPIALILGIIAPKPKSIFAKIGLIVSGIMLIVIVIRLIMGIGAGVVAYNMIQEDEQVMQQPIRSEHKIAKDEPKKQNTKLIRSLDSIGILYPLDTITVKLKDGKYLKTSMSLELASDELALELDTKHAVIKDRIVRVLASKTLEDLSSMKKKEKLTKQILDTINPMLVDGEIESIYFTEFVIQ